MKFIHIHIFLSTLAFGVLCLAAVQALLLAAQERLLRHNQTSRFLNKLPALQTMERFLFRIIAIGFILFTFVIITSFYTFHDVFTPIFLQKKLLSLFAWLVFLLLLIGRYVFGWRGLVAIRWTLLGVGLVVLIYVGAIFFR